MNLCSYTYSAIFKRLQVIIFYRKLTSKEHHLLGVSHSELFCKALVEQNHAEIAAPPIRWDRNKSLVNPADFCTAAGDLASVQTSDPSLLPSRRRMMALQVSRPVFPAWFFTWCNFSARTYSISRSFWRSSRRASTSACTKTARLHNGRWHSETNDLLLAQSWITRINYSIVRLDDRNDIYRILNNRFQRTENFHEKQLFIVLFVHVSRVQIAIAEADIIW